MKDFITRHKRKIGLFLGIFMVLLILFSLAVYTKWIDFGIDALTKPKKREDWYLEDINGQLHLHSSKSKFDVKDSIILTLNTAYFDQTEQAQRAEYVYFRVIHCEYLEIEVNDASDSYPASPTPPDVDPNPTIPKGDVDYFFIFREFDPDQLVYQPHDGIITRDSLPYAVRITIRVKPDAPENFEDEFTIITGVHEDLSPGPDYIPVYSSQKNSRISIRIVKDGDTVKIYE